MCMGTLSQLLIAGCCLVSSEGSDSDPGVVPLWAILRECAAAECEIYRSLIHRIR